MSHLDLRSEFLKSDSAPEVTQPMHFYDKRLHHRNYQYYRQYKRCSHGDCQSAANAAQRAPLRNYRPPQLRFPLHTALDLSRPKVQTQRAISNRPCSKTLPDGGPPRDRDVGQVHGPQTGRQEVLSRPTRLLGVPCLPSDTTRRQVFQQDGEGRLRKTAQGVPLCYENETDLPPLLY